MEGPEFYLRTAERVLSVRELAAGLRRQIETRFSDVWVEGEISNCRTPGSGHCYFTLKDPQAQLKCVMWRSSLRAVRFDPRDGMHVRIRGAASVYEARGDLQIVARSMEAAGEGALQQAFEALKRKLAAEGLFDPAHKKRIPAFPLHIGLVTSGDGAALQDILSILRRRYPLAAVSVLSVRVQGYGSAEEIAAAVGAFDAMNPSARPDVLIVGRGGGSLEDLWAFNEEAVARALFSCSIPIVSAVGHETDFSIADFVADQRAATPSMAAELVAPDRVDLERRIRVLHARMRRHALALLDQRRRFTVQVARSYALNRPLERLRQHQQRVDELGARLERAVLRRVERGREQREALLQRLLLLDPARPLSRGYAAVERDGVRVRRSEELQTGDRVVLHFIDGGRGMRVEE